MLRNNGIFLTLVLVMFTLLLAGCFSPEIIPAPQEQYPSPVATLPEDMPRLRIQNVGARDIQGLTVIFPGGRIDFGDIPAGATTAYLPAPGGVYNYAAYSFLKNGQEMSQPVVDWVGESPRPGKSFTYVLDYSPDRPQMIRLISVLNE